MIDVDVLTRPLAQDRPCGENLDSQAAFQALEEAARGKPERYFGSRDGTPTIAAEPPAWGDVRKRALDLLGRSRDLRVAVLLTRALTRTSGLAGLAGGLELIHGLVDNLWDDVHPKDPDDASDPTMRMNVLATLVDPAALIADLRAATFVSDPRLGPCSVRQLEIALGLAKASGDESEVPRAQIEGMLREAAGNGLVNEAASALAQAERLAAALAARVGAERSLDLEPLVRRLRPIAAFYRQVVPDAAPAQAEAAAIDAAVTNDDASATKQPDGVDMRSIGEIRSREEAVELLGKVCDFLERTEPTNPAPLLIRRAQRLMAMNFVDILRDLAPEGVSAVSKIAGLPVEAK